MVKIYLSQASLEQWSLIFSNFSQPLTLGSVSDRGNDYPLLYLFWDIVYPNYMDLSKLTI